MKLITAVNANYMLGYCRNTDKQDYGRYHVYNRLQYRLHSMRPVCYDRQEDRWAPRLTGKCHLLISNEEDNGSHRVTLRTRLTIKNELKPCLEVYFSVSVRKLVLLLHQFFVGRNNSIFSTRFFDSDVLAFIVSNWYNKLCNLLLSIWTFVLKK